MLVGGTDWTDAYHTGHDDRLRSGCHQGWFCDRKLPVLRHFPHSLSLPTTVCGQCGRLSFVREPHHL